MKTEPVTRGDSPAARCANQREKLASPVTLFGAIEAEQRAALRAIAFTERRSLADVFGKHWTRSWWSIRAALGRLPPNTDYRAGLSAHLRPPPWGSAYCNMRMCVSTP